MLRSYYYLLCVFASLLPLVAAAQWTPRPGVVYLNFATEITFWNNTFYAADQERLLRSDNFGQTWQNCSVGPNATGCIQIAVGTEGVYVGLTDGNIRVSHDDGASWQLACPTAPTGVGHLAVLDGDIFAAAENNALSVYQQATGQWMPVAALSTVTINRLAVQGSQLFASTSAGVKYSADHGSSWQSVTGPLPKFTDLMAVGTALWALAPDQGFRVSNDGGHTWSIGSLGNASGAKRACYDAGHNRFYFIRHFPVPGYWNIWSYTPGTGSQRLTDFEGNPAELSANSGVVLATITSQILRSTDDGGHWRSETNGIIPYANVVLEGDLGNHFLKAGPLLSINDGNTWFQPLDSAASYYGLRNYARMGDTLFALDVWTSNYYKLFVSTPPYLAWPVRDTSWIFAASDGKLAVQGADLLFIAYTPNAWKLYRSPDRGLSWTFSGDFPTETRVAIVHHGLLIAMDESDQVWRSINGTSWAMVAQLPQIIGAYRLKSENGQLVATHNSLFDQENFMRSKDDGLTWTKINTNLSDPHGLGFKHAAVRGDTLAVANELGCFISLDGGTSWIDVTDNLLWVDISELLFYQGQLFRAGGPNYVHSLENLSSVRATGSVYWDQNHNGVRDALEPALPNYVVEMRRSGSIRLTAADGTFLITGTVSPDTIEVQLPAAYGQVSPTFASIDSTLNGLEFGVWYPPGQLDRRISLAALDPFRPGFSTRLQVHCFNAGSDETAAIIRLSLPPGLELLSTNPSPAAATNDSIRWEIPSLAMFGQAIFNFTIKTPPTVALGALLTFTTQVGPLVSDLQPVDNVDTSTFTVVGAYDPNDKQVNQGSTLSPNQLADGRSFHYTIRFQNTGTYPAEGVRVVDTLPSTLDPASFQLLSSSHPVQVSLHNERVLEFLFDTIGLPASSAKPLGSQGFVQFAVQPRPGLVDGDQIRNNAAIYFDYNLPILTNTSLVGIEGILPVSEASSFQELRILPNPAIGRFTADLPGAGQVEVFDAQGRLLLVRRATAGPLQIEGSHWPPGIYTVVWRGADSLRVGKVILQ